MTKANIVDEISKKSELTKKNIGIIVDSLIKYLKIGLNNGEHIELRGFGTLGTKKRNARFARNPKTNKKIFIPEHKIVYFKPGKELKEKVKNANFGKK